MGVKIAEDSAKDKAISLKYNTYCLKHKIYPTWTKNIEIARSVRV